MLESAPQAADQDSTPTRPEPPNAEYCKV